MFETHRAHADRIVVCSAYTEQSETSNRGNQPVGSSSINHTPYPTPEAEEHDLNHENDPENNEEPVEYQWADHEGDVITLRHERPAKSRNKHAHLANLRGSSGGFRSLANSKIGGK